MERFTGDPNTPEGRRALKRMRKIKRSVFFDGGAAADVETLRQAAPEPADFDAFWARQKAELKKVPFNAKRVEVPSGNPDVRLYALSVDCTGGMPVTGYLSIPKAAEKGKKFGIHVGAFGYGVGEQFAPRHPSADAIEFKMNAHGFLLREFGGTDEYYRTYGEKIMSNGYTYAFDPQQNSNPETAYFRGMILRLIRGLQYLKSCPEWDGKDLQVSGNSQGGGTALVVGSMNKNITCIVATVPALCDHGGWKFGRQAGWPQLHANLKGKADPWMAYFDAVNFAARIKVPTLVSAGYVDVTCSPASVFAAFNAIPTGVQKTIFRMPRSGHRGTGALTPVLNKFLQEQLTK